MDPATISGAIAAVVGEIVAAIEAIGAAVATVSKMPGPEQSLTLRAVVNRRDLR